VIRAAMFVQLHEFFYMLLTFSMIDRCYPPKTLILSVILTRMLMYSRLCKVGGFCVSACFWAEKLFPPLGLGL
jgi:hypothetical protein